MGYEIIFSYHEKVDGKLNTEETKTFTKNVGRRNAEVTEEQVAAVVLGQYANRDIYVSDVKIYEYAKKEVSFKETKGGVIIRGKKFSFDQLHGALKADDEPQEYIENQQPSIPIHPGVPMQMPQFNPTFANQVIQKTNSKRDPNVPIRNEVFRPSREDYPALQRQGVKLTMEKEYSLYGEIIKNESEPIYYVVKDDGGNRIELSSLYFEPVRRGLIGIGKNDPQYRPSEGRLSYVDYGSGVVERGGVPTNNEATMPTLRRNY